MSQRAIEFLETCRPEGVASCERLIRLMTKVGCTKLVLSDHPDYGFVHGVIGSDVETPELGDTVQMVEDFFDRYRQFQSRDADADDDNINMKVRWSWIRDCWLEARGPESGKTVVLFNNGMGDMMDLNTGKEPDDKLEIDDLVW